MTTNHIKLPDWIPLEAWQGFIEMRKSINKPLKTQRAINLNLNTLARLRDEGNDPEEVLNQSVASSWQGLFPIRQERRTQSQGVKLSPLGKVGQATANNLQDWLEEA